MCLDAMPSDDRFDAHSGYKVKIFDYDEGPLKKDPTQANYRQNSGPSAVIKHLTSVDQ